MKKRHFLELGRTQLAIVTAIFFAVINYLPPAKQPDAYVPLFVAFVGLLMPAIDYLVSLVLKR